MIRSKSESDALLLRKGVNIINQINTEASNKDEILEFMHKSNATKFSIRDKSNSCGKFLYDIYPEEVFAVLPEYKRVCVYDSMKQFDPHLILQGDICINSDFTCQASLSTIPGITNRVAMQNPELYLNFDICGRIPRVTGLSKILDIVIQAELFDCVVEFTDYGVPVGNKYESIIIWEARNY